MIDICDVDYHSVWTLPIKCSQVLLETGITSKAFWCLPSITIISLKPRQSPFQKIVRLGEPVSEVAWLSIKLDRFVMNVISVWSKGYTQLPSLLLILRCHSVHNLPNVLDVFLQNQVKSYHNIIQLSMEGGWGWESVKSYVEFIPCKSRGGCPRGLWPLMGLGRSHGPDRVCAWGHGHESQ